MAWWVGALPSCERAEGYVAAFGCTEVTKSLKTQNEAEAKRLEKVQDVKFEDRLREAQDAATPEKRRSQTAAQFIAKVSGDPIGTWGERVLELEDGGLALDEFLSTVPVEDRTRVASLIRGAVDERIYTQVMIQGLVRDAASVLARAQLEADPVQVEPKLPAPSECSCPFGVIFRKWEAEQRPTAKTPYSWKTIMAKLVGHLRHVDKVSETELMMWNAASLTEQDVLDWKDALVAARLSPTTIENHLTVLRTMYNYAKANKLVSATIVDAVKAVRFKAKKRPGTKKLGFTDEEAALILTAARAETDPVLRWSPWLVAATGSRIDEICGAMVADIVFDQGIYWLHVGLANRIGDEEQNAEIKTENSERTVPIHPSVIDERFLEYVEKLPKGGPLFPKLTPDMFGRRGGNGSKRVGRWVRKKLKITDPRKSPSHSWRHRFRSICRNPRYQISEDVTDYMSEAMAGSWRGRPQLR